MQSRSKQTRDAVAASTSADRWLFEQAGIDPDIPPDERTVDRLIGLLGHPNSLTRRIAALALGKLKARRAVPALVALLQTETDRVWGAAESAAAALEEIGDLDAVE